MPSLAALCVIALSLFLGACRNARAEKTCRDQLDARAYDVDESLLAATRPALAEFRNRPSGQKVRDHAWNLWIALNRPITKGCSYPVWASWGPRDEKGKLLKTTWSAARAPAQFDDLQKKMVRVFNVIYHNDATQRAIHAQKLGSLDVQKKFSKEKISIGELPPNSISVKAIWAPLLKHMGCLIVPVWTQGDDHDYRGDGARPFENWAKRVVVFHPETTPSVLPKQAYCGFPAQYVGTYDVVPLSEFHTRKLETAEDGTNVYDAIKHSLPSFTKPPFLPPTMGDYMLLAGLHVTTKEIPEWLWVTFWWTEAADRRPENPYYGDRPADRIANLLGRDSPFGNYSMDSATDAEKITFNPYLEAQTTGPPGGTSSNCMACHDRASAMAPDPFRQDNSRGRMQIDKLLGVKLDFLWSLAKPKD